MAGLRGCKKPFFLKVAAETGQDVTSSRSLTIRDPFSTGSLAVNMRKLGGEPSVSRTLSPSKTTVCVLKVQTIRAKIRLYAVALEGYALVG